MARRDFYEVLGAERGASGTDLKEAYRRLAMKHHPDHNPDDKEAEDKFKEANKACEVLSNTNRRAVCDQYGHAGADPNIGGGAGAGLGEASFSNIFGNVFGDFFGDGGVYGGSRGGTQRGTDLRCTLDLGLEEVARDITVTTRVPTLIGCKICNGSDAKPGTTPVTCTTYSGIGQVRMQQGFFSVQRTCPHCHGTGKMISYPCGSCHGQGRVEEQKTPSVKVPAGVDTGDRIRLTGEGKAGSMGGPTGDLYVVVNIHERLISQRDGKRLYCKVPVNLADAASDGELGVPTLDDRVRLKIPEGIQTGKLFRLRGKGVAPVRGGGTGNLICKVVVKTPVNLDKHQRGLFEEFRRSLQSDTPHSPKASSWSEGMKRFFDDL